MKLLQRITAIRDRIQQEKGILPELPSDDVDHLHAELIALRVENERLKTAVTTYADLSAALASGRKTLLAENEQFRAALAPQGRPARAASARDDLAVPDGAEPQEQGSANVDRVPQQE